MKLWGSHFKKLSSWGKQLDYRWFMGPFKGSNSGIKPTILRISWGYVQQIPSGDFTYSYGIDGPWWPNDFYGFSDPTRQWEKHQKLVHMLLNESAKRPGREKKVTYIYLHTYILYKSENMAQDTLMYFWVEAVNFLAKTFNQSSAEGSWSWLFQPQRIGKICGSGSGGTWWTCIYIHIYIIVPWCMCKYILYIYILDSCNTSFVTLDLKVFLTIWLSQYVHKLSFHFQGQKAWTLLSFRAHLLPKGMGQHGSSLPAVQLAWTQDSSEIKSKVLFRKIQISLGSSGTGREQRVNWRA